MAVVRDELGTVYLGGPYGDTLYLAAPDGDFRPVHSFGIEKGRQAAKQRRILLTPGAIFVLEPAETVRFGDGDLRVRRLDRSGVQVGEETGPGDDGPAQLVAFATQNPEDREDGRLTVLGVDPDSGRPLRWMRRCATGVNWRPWTRRGVVLVTGDTTLVGVRGGSLLIWTGDQPQAVRISSGAVQQLGQRTLVAGIRSKQSAVWLDGVFVEADLPSLWTPSREYQGPFAVERADGSIVLLRADGGELPSIGGAPGHLPPGIYDALVERRDGVFGLEISNEPRWVSAEL